MAFVSCARRMNGGKFNFSSYFIALIYFLINLNHFALGFVLFNFTFLFDDIAFENSTFISSQYKIDLSFDKHSKKITEFSDPKIVCLMEFVMVSVPNYLKLQSYP